MVNLTQTIGGAPPIPTSGINERFVVVIGLVSLFTALATTAVLLRFVSRKIHDSIGVDDWCSLLSLVLSYGFLIIIVLVATVGRGGWHIAGYNRDQLELFVKLLVAEDVIYASSISISKVTVLLFYLRLFGSIKKFKRMAWFLIVLVFAHWITSVCGILFAWDPIEAQWKPWIPYTVINVKLFWILTGVPNVLLDVATLLLPQQHIWKLNQTRRRRTLLSLLLLTGLLTCIISIIRLASLESIDINDPTYTAIYPDAWGNLEQNMSIICGCGPMLPALLRQWFNSPHWSSLVSRLRSSFSRESNAGLIRKDDSLVNPVAESTPLPNLDNGDVCRDNRKTSSVVYNSTEV